MIESVEFRKLDVRSGHFFQDTIIISSQDNWETLENKSGIFRILDYKFLHRLYVNIGFAHKSVYWEAHQ